MNMRGVTREHRRPTLLRCSPSPTNCLAYAAPGGAGRTTAQMSAEQKNAISHRHRALVRLNTLLDEAGV
mgnify:CR=1 FL=1